MSVVCPLVFGKIFCSISRPNNNGQEYVLSGSVRYISPVRCDRAFTHINLGVQPVKNAVRHRVNILVSCVVLVVVCQIQRAIFVSAVNDM